MNTRLTSRAGGMLRWSLVAVLAASACVLLGRGIAGHGDHAQHMERLMGLVEQDFALASPVVQGSRVVWRQGADPRGEVLVACSHRERRSDGVVWQDHTCVVDASVAPTVAGRALPFTVEEADVAGSGFRASFAARG